MKVHKVVICVVDHDELGADGVVQELGCARFANDCMHPQVMSIETVDIGEWREQHPLNVRGKSKAAFASLFKGKT